MTFTAVAFFTFFASLASATDSSLNVYVLPKCSI